jgi:hypothetical protein
MYLQLLQRQDLPSHVTGACSMKTYTFESFGTFIFDQAIVVPPDGCLQTVAEDEYEKALISAVIPPNEVGVKFDQIGALENVKAALKELVMLPLQRPELFCKGNLTRVCATSLCWPSL